MAMTYNDRIIKECIKQNIKKYRVTNELTQSQVCEAIGTSRTTYTKWECGDSMPNIVQLAKLGMIYGVKTDAFLDGMDQFSVAYGYNELYGEKYLSDLSDDERYIIMRYRMLNKSDKKKIKNFIESNIIEQK